MPRKTTHPEGLREVNAIKITEDIRTFVSNLAQDVTSEKTNRGRWESNIDRLIELRYGVRQKKTHPWTNAANYMIPLIDTRIQELKPSYAALANATPVVVFDPYGGEDIEPSRKREQLFDWRMRTRVKFYPQYCIGIDKELEQGSVIYKIVWNYTTRSYTEEFDINDFSNETIGGIYDPRTNDQLLQKIIIEELGIDEEFEENIEEVIKAIQKFREGETSFTLKLIEVENNQPEVTACSVRDDIVVPEDTTDLQWARFIANTFWRTTTQVKIGMRDEKYETYDDNTIKAWGAKQADKAHRNLTGGKELDEVHELAETCCWYDVNDDGILERCIATYPVSAPQDVLRFIEVPYDHGQFPYVQVRRELNDPGFYSPRGIPQLLEDYQQGISTAVNQAEDNGTIMNKPVIVMRRNTVTNIKNRRFVPGETIETTGSPDDYQIRQLGNITQPVLFQLAQYLKSWADNRVKSMAGQLSQDVNLPGMGQGGKKTAREVSEVKQGYTNEEAFDLSIHQVQMAGVYYQIDALYEQYGDEEEEFLTTGQKPIKVSRRETQGKWNIIPNGRLDNTNPILRATKAFNLMKVFAGDPDIKQIELKKIFLEDYDYRIAKRILYTDEEKAKLNNYQQQFTEAMRQKAIKEGIDIKEIETMIDLQKEVFMALIHGRKYAPDPEKPAKEEIRP